MLALVVLFRLTVFALTVVGSSFASVPVGGVPAVPAISGVAFVVLAEAAVVVLAPSSGGADGTAPVFV